MKLTAKTANAIVLPQKQNDIMTYTATIEIEYNDTSSFTFEVSIDGEDYDVISHLQMITSGTLTASTGQKATCYTPDGFEVCSYIR